MEGIKEFLQRYINIAPPDTVIRRAVAESLQELLGREIPERLVKIIGTVAYLEIDTTTKSVLFMKQEKILKRIEEKLGKRNVTALR